MSKATDKAASPVTKDQRIAAHEARLARCDCERKTYGGGQRIESHARDCSVRDYTEPPAPEMVTDTWMGGGLEITYPLTPDNTDGPT